MGDGQRVVKLRRGERRSPAGSGCERVRAGHAAQSRAEIPSQKPVCPQRRPPHTTETWPCPEDVHSAKCISCKTLSLAKVMSFLHLSDKILFL